MIYTNENWKPPVTYCEPNKVEVQRMNKEEAIEILRDIYQFLRTQYTHRYKQKEAIDLAIEVLRTEPVCEHFYKGYCSRFDDGCFCQCRKG